MLVFLGIIVLLSAYDFLRRGKRLNHVHCGCLCDVLIRITEYFNGIFMSVIRSCWSWVDTKNHRDMPWKLSCGVCTVYCW